MQKRSGGSKSNFSAVDSVTFRTGHGRFRTESIRLELVLKLSIGIGVVLVAGGRWNRLLAD